MTLYATQTDAVKGEEEQIKNFRMELIELCKKHEVHVIAVGTRTGQPITFEGSMICAGFVVPTVDGRRQSRELDAIIESYEHAGVIIERMKKDSQQKQAIDGLAELLKKLGKTIGEVKFEKEGEKVRATFTDEKKFDAYLFGFGNNEQEAIFDLFTKWSKK